MMATATENRRTDRDPAVRLAGITRHFGATRALKGIDLEIARGEIHALVGENGAGKSTALGILAGRIAPTAGCVEIFGQELKYGDPRASRKAGVVAIYQELTIVPQLSPEANVFLGQTLARAGFLSSAAMRGRYVRLCREVGVRPQPPGVPAAGLPVAEQQILEILRALVSEAEIILFDEPTAALGPAEREALFKVMRDLQARGMTIVFVSHNLDEVLSLADTITVFRDGELRQTLPRGSWDKHRLVESMLGREGDVRVMAELLDESAPLARKAARISGEVLLHAEGVTVPGSLFNIDLELRAGEVLGIGGLVGSGRTTLLRALAGLEPGATGKLWVRGHEVSWPRTARRARALGIALLPEDRKGQGIWPALPAMDNVVMSDLGRVASHGLLRPSRTYRAAAEVVPDFGFDRARLRTLAGQLSGGNQQKLLLARWRHSPPAVLLADEPTRGIDIGAKEEITRALEAMAADGLGIVVVSSELEEVVALSDRVLVLSEGRATGHLGSKGEITVSDILHAAFRVESS
jgi:rhamnose transport system ATP-binding protein